MYLQFHVLRVYIHPYQKAPTGYGSQVHLNTGSGTESGSRVQLFIVVTWGIIRFFSLDILAWWLLHNSLLADPPRPVFECLPKRYHLLEKTHSEGPFRKPILIMSRCIRLTFIHWRTERSILFRASILNGTKRKEYHQVEHDTALRVVSFLAMLPFHSNPAGKKSNKLMMPPYPLVVIFTANLARVL